MKLEIIENLGFIQERKSKTRFKEINSIGYFGGIARIKQDSKKVHEGIFVHLENPRVFLILKDNIDGEFTLALLSDGQGLEHSVTIQRGMAGRDIDFESFIISEYVKKYKNRIS